DEEFDKTHQLHSIPAMLGKRKALNVSVVIHIITAILVVVVGVTAHFHLIYWVGAAVFISLLIYQHVIVSPDDLSKVNIAFGNTNGVASVLFAIFTLCALSL